MLASELTGVALAWAVAKALRIRVLVPNCWKKCDPPVLAKFTHAKNLPWGPPAWKPHEKWDQAGPIIEREMISVVMNLERSWSAYRPSGALASGSTALEAAMRSFVLDKLGSQVALPKWLEKIAMRGAETVAKSG